MHKAPLDHSKLYQLLAKKLSGEASNAELKELDDYILANPDCIYYVDAFEEIWKKKEVVHEDLESAFARHLDKFEEDYQGTETKVRRIRFWHIAACILPLLVMTLFYIFKIERSNKVPKLTEFISGKAIRRKLTLPDGTRVWLNADSRISFNSEKDFAFARNVNLTGEAFFDVVKDKRHPFVIHTPKFSIKVLGTAFDVKAYPQDKHLETTLLRGKIELTVNDRPLQKIILNPNEKFVLTEQVRDQSGNQNLNQEDRTKMLVELVQPVTIAHKEYNKEVDWLSNQMVINNETLEDLVPRLERWYNVKISISNPIVRKYKFTVIFKDESIEEALSAMTLIEPFKFKSNANEINIY